MDHQRGAAIRKQQFAVLIVTVLSFAPAAFAGSDLSRNTFGPQGAFSGVKLQQGTTQTDRDATGGGISRRLNMNSNPTQDLQQGHVQSDNDRPGRFDAIKKPR